MHEVKRLHEIEFEDEAKGIIHEACETIREVKDVHEVKSEVVQVQHEIIHEVKIENKLKRSHRGQDVAGWSAGAQSSSEPT